MTTDVERVLFVCTNNLLRSPTAERLWRDVEQIEVRSRGTAPTAEQRISTEDVDWADQIVVMEKRHARVIRQLFPDLLGDTPVHVLGIRDVYDFMDPELVEILKREVPGVLQSA